MRFKSKNLAHFAELLNQNQKFDFNTQLGDWTLKITKNGDIAIRLLPMLLRENERFWLNFKQSGDTVLFYDAEIKLNRKWARIWTGQTPTCDEGELKLGMCANELQKTI